MRLGPRTTVVALLGAVVAALVVFAIVLSDSQRSAREDIEGRVHDRAVAAAALIGSIFQSSVGSSQALYAQRYGGPEIPQDALARQAREGGSRFLAVTGPDGRPLAVAPEGAAPDLAASEPVRAVARGRPYAISDLVGLGPRAGRGFVFAQAFQGGQGRRMLVSGIDARFLARFFVPSLEQLPARRGGRTYLLDSRGAVLASPDPGTPLGSLPVEPGLLRAVGRSDEGEHGDDRHFAAAPVPGTPWRVVRTAPADRLFASVRGINQWGPWLLFALFGFAGLTAVALVGRAFRDARRVDVANRQLERANATLELRARELARSNEELEHFASIASHDLREPLRKVQMFSERVTHHEAENLSDRGRDYLARMDSAARRMQELIDGLLAYSRVSGPDDLQDVDLGQVTRDVVEDLDAVLRETGGTVEVGELPHVAGDELQLRQLVQNLVSNALRFHREDAAPRVRVTGREEEGEVVLEVADDGIGIDPAHAGRIFQLFERLHPRSAYPGAGLGLALCRRIADRHGGSIAVRSTPGEGATFIVRLPRDPVRSAPDREPENEVLAHS